MEVDDESETDGLKSMDVIISETNEAVPSNPIARNRTFGAGFGFTRETIQFRITDDTNERSSLTKGAADTEQADANEQKEIEQEVFRDTSDRIDKQEAALSSIFENLNIPMDWTDHAKHDAFPTLDTPEVEIDTIIPQKVQEKLLSAPPVSVSYDHADYVDMNPRQLPTQDRVMYLCIPIGRRKPDEQTKIIIPHDKADKTEGDYFGANLCTFKDERTDGTAYYRHFLVEVDPDGPASQMRICNNDELVLLDEVFAPELTHKEILDQFRGVEVDGETRFSLVIRRVKHEGKWEWIETSAILAPYKEIVDHPHVERVEVRELQGEKIEVPESKHVYNVPGSQDYLDICDGKVSIDALNNDESDKTKIIWKRARYWQGEGDQINFAAALRDVTKKWYIGVDGNRIVLKGDPVWFKMIKIGSKIRFKFDKQYLGYDRQSGVVKPEISQCVFEEFPASKINTEFQPSHPGNSSFENIERMSCDSRHSCSTSSLSSVHSDRKSIASSQRSIDSNTSSNLSSQVSTDSGGLFDELNRSYDGGAVNCIETPLLPLSQTSNTSDYISNVSDSNEEETIVKDSTDILFSESDKKKKQKNIR